VRDPVSNAKQLVKRAEATRVREHRLKPGFRLRTREEVYRFIHGEGLVSFLGGNELPSLISAVLGRSWKPSKKGFTGWYDWWSVKVSGQPMPQVSKELEGRDDVLATRLFRRTKTLVSKTTWPVLDPIVKHHRELVQRGEVLSDLERRLLETIESESKIRTDRLRKKLGLEAKENNSRFHRALTNLESYSLIVGAEDPHPETHLHANIWQTWDNRTKTKKVNISYKDALTKLLEKTINACVLAREDQVEKWFVWRADMGTLSKELLRNETVLKAGPYLIASRIRTINN